MVEKKRNIITKDLKLTLRNQAKIKSLQDLSNSLNIQSSQFYNMVDSKTNIIILKLLIAVQKESGLEGTDFLDYVSNLLKIDSDN